MESELLNTLLADIKTAMKAQEKEKVTTLRMLHSEIKNAELIDRKEINDELIASIVTKAIKQRTESIDQFTKAGRQDLADKEKSQIEMYSKYLPEQLSEEEIEGIVSEAIEESGAKGKNDIGKVMKIVMPKTRGKADGKMVNSIVLSKLE